MDYNYPYILSQFALAWVTHKPKLLTQIQEKLRTASYTSKTIYAYLKRIKEFILFNNKKHTSELGKERAEIIKKINTYDGNKKNTRNLIKAEQSG